MSQMRYHIETPEIYYCVQDPDQPNQNVVYVQYAFDHKLNGQTIEQFAKRFGNWMYKQHPDYFTNLKDQFTYHIFTGNLNHQPYSDGYQRVNQLDKFFEITQTINQKLQSKNLNETQEPHWNTNM